jgi:hypothetical protein
MTYRVDWKLHYQSPRIRGKRFAPKRPVNWKGGVTMTYKNEKETMTDSREWVSPYPLTRDQALDVMKAMLQDIIDDSGQGAIGAAFWMEVT